MSLTPAPTVSGPGPAAAFAPGARLGDYHIVREAGRGAMGVVYEAVHAALDKRVALKVLPPNLAADRLDRFLREARIAAGLHHTNIVPVFDVGVADGVPFYAMQFIDGRPLAAGLGTLTVANIPAPDDQTLVLAADTPGPPPRPGMGPAEAARYALQVAEGLAYAHERGVVHRDVKPANLLLDRQGVVWITDFGLAFRADDATLTEDGAILGTPRYMAPEQARGAADIDARADVYALGVTLYELLTGRPALPGRNAAELLRQVEEYTPPPARSCDRHIPRDLETITAKAMAKRPADRYQTSRALADDLKRYLAGEPIKARRISPAGRAWRWAKRHPSVASLLAAVLLVFAAGAAVSGYFAAEARQRAAEAGASAREARLREADALVASARGTRLSKRMGQRFDALAALKKAADIGHDLGQPAEWFAPLRNEAVNALALADLQIAETFPRWEEGAPISSVSPDLRWYAQSVTGGCVVRRLADRAEVFRVTGLTGTGSCYFGPAGRVAVLDGETRKAQVWDLGGPEPVRLWETANVAGWSFGPTGDLLAVSGQDGSIVVRDLAAGADRYRLPPGRVTNSVNIFLHPTAPYVAVSSYHQPGAEIRDLRTGKASPLAPAWTGGCGSVAWHPDGKSFVLTDGNAGRLQLYDFDPDRASVRLRDTVEHTGDACGGVVYNPAGDRLLIRGWSNVATLHDAVTGRVLFRTPTLRFISSTFDTTGRRLAAVRLGDTDDRIGLLAVGDGRECRFVHCPKRSEHHSLVEIAGGRLVAAQAGPDLVFVSPTDGRVVARVPVPGGTGGGVAICTDGLGRFVVNSSGGCFRWPVAVDPTDPNRVRVGPPEKLPFFPGDHPIASSRDGRVVAQVMWAGYHEAPYAGGWVFNAAVPGGARRVEPVHGGAVTSVSPDGRFVAFGLDRLRVYDAATLEEKWNTPGVGWFTPDGRWLASWSTGGRLFAVGTWEPGPRLGDGDIRAISPDGRYALLGVSGGVFRYVEVDTGRELIRFEDPDLKEATAAFSADGATLYTAAADGFRAWDLRLIRRQLADLRLDWDTPDFPPAAPAAGPVRVEVIGADLLDRNARRRFEYLKAATETVAAAVAPYRKNATAADSLRRGQAFTREEWFDLALRDYDEAVRRDPALADAREARGLEHFRRRQWRPAIDDFDVVLGKTPKRIRSLLRRAWAYHELGRPADAAADLTTLLAAEPIQPADRAGLLVQRAAVWAKAGEKDKAAADRAAARAVPNAADGLNAYAWQLLVNRPERRVDAAALVMAEEAVALAPAEAMYFNTLGLALYRTGRSAEAVPVLEKSLKLGDGKHDGWDLYVLAMCHRGLGDGAKARGHFDRAEAWRKAATGFPVEMLAELADLRAEARRVVGR